MFYWKWEIINSGEHNGKSNIEFKKIVIKLLEDKNQGEKNS